MSTSYVTPENWSIPPAAADVFSGVSTQPAADNNSP